MKNKLFIISITRVTLITLRLINLILLAKISSVADFGHISVLIIGATFASEISNLGLSSYLQRETKLGNAGAIYAVIRVNSRSSIMFLVLSFVAIYYYCLTYNLSPILSITIPIFILLERNYDLYLSYFYSKKKHWVVFISSGSSIFINFTFVVANYLSFQNLSDLYFFIRMFAAFPLISLSVYIFLSHMKPKKLDKIAIKSILYDFGLLNLANSIRSLDLIVVLLVSGSIQAGFYSASTRLLLPFMVVINLLTPILLNYVMKSNQNYIKAINQFPKVFLALVLLSIMLAINAPFLVAVVYGKLYSGSSMVLIFHFLAIPFVILNPLFSTVLISTHQESKLKKLTVLNTILFILLIVIGSLAYGAVGASIAFLLSNITRYIYLKKLQYSVSNPKRFS